MRRVLGLACWLVLTAPASAHSPPHGQQLLWSSDAADALPLIVSNRGLVFADQKDGALQFSLRCTEGYGASVADNPGVFFVPDGSLAVGIYSGVYASSDRACTLQPGTGLVGTSFSMAVGHPGAPGRLLTSSRTLQEQAQVFISQDYGRTWSVQYQNHVDDYYNVLLAAPSDAQRVYASGLRADRAGKKLLHLTSVSLDAGRNWQDTATEAEIIPFAVHSSNADVVFAYQPTDTLKTVFKVLRSEDRGVNFATVLEGVPQPSAVALSSSGTTLWLGIGGAGGLYRSTDDGRHFERTLEDALQSVTCLEQRAGRLWICGNAPPNTDGVWFSEDDGESLQKFMVFADISQQVLCDGEAEALCAGPWLDFDRELHPPALDGGADAGMADAAVGAGDAGTALAMGGTSDASGELDAGSAPTTQKHASGCQLGAPRRSGMAGWLTLLVAPLWLAARLQRRRPHQRVSA